MPRLHEPIFKHFVASETSTENEPQVGLYWRLADIPQRLYYEFGAALRPRLKRIV